MTYTYEIIEMTSIDGSVNKVIHRIEDNAFIPMNEANPDYQAYLESLNETKTK